MYIYLIEFGASLFSSNSDIKIIWDIAQLIILQYIYTLCRLCISPPYNGIKSSIFSYSLYIGPKLWVTKVPFHNFHVTKGFNFATSVLWMTFLLVGWYRTGAVTAPVKYEPDIK